MIRFFLNALALLTVSMPLAVVAKPIARMPVEAELTTESVPGGIHEGATFGERVEIDGDWLAVSERQTSDWSLTMKIHLFQREFVRGKAPRWTWRQVLNVGKPWTVGMDSLPSFVMDGGSLVVPEPIPGGVTFYRQDDVDGWKAAKTLTEVDGERCSGSPVMRLRGNRLFLPGKSAGHLLVLVRKGTAPIEESEWAVEAVIPVSWGYYFSEDLPILDTDGESLILRNLVPNSRGGSSFQVQILSRESGWRIEATLSDPEHVEFPDVSGFGSSVAISGSQAWIMERNFDALGNIRGGNHLYGYRKLGTRWIATGRTAVASPYATQVAASTGLVATFGYVDSYWVATPMRFMGTTTLYRPMTFNVGETALPATGISFGGNGMFASTTWFANETEPQGIVRVYRDPFAVLYRRPGR